MDGSNSGEAVLALVRHGHYVQGEGVPSAHLPHPLTARGREQAATCVEGLRALASERGLTIAPVRSSTVSSTWYGQGASGSKVTTVSPLRSPSVSALAAGLDTSRHA